MYAYLRGTLEEVHQNKIVVDVNGFGFEVNIPISILDRLPAIGEYIKVYTYFNVREDSQELYGFLEREEKAIFEKLITVSGIGPKGALSILSKLSPSQIALAIVMNDIKTLSQAPGVGKKTAQRIILELKEKMDQEFLMDQRPTPAKEETDTLNEAVYALMALGYQSHEAQYALRQIENKDRDLSTLIRLALKALDKSKR